jgi:hypothetical protein
MVASKNERLCRWLIAAAKRLKHTIFRWFTAFLGIDLFSRPYFYRQIFVLETYH